MTVNCHFAEDVLESSQLVVALLVPYSKYNLLACVEEEGGLRNEAGVVVDEGAAITAGRYTYVRKGNFFSALTLVSFCLSIFSPSDSAESPCKFRRGPEGKTKGKAPASGASSSTYSNSKRSSNNQVW